MDTKEMITLEYALNYRLHSRFTDCSSALGGSIHLYADEQFIVLTL